MRSVASFLGELTRRKVWLFGGIYLALGWVMLQVAIAVEATMKLPDWIDQSVLVLLVIGFPFALLLAWAQESQGESKAEDKSAGDETPVVAPKDHYTPSFSLAVLPFENFSDDKQLGWIADGMSEDILTQLSAMPRLGVCARNSSFQYKGRSPDLRQVGKDLDVRYMLEGSLRKQGDALRITAQLIEAETGNHAWAGQFNPALTEIADLHDQVIDNIVGEVHSSIFSNEFRRLAKVPEDEVSSEDAAHLSNRAFIRGEFGKALHLADRSVERGGFTGSRALTQAQMRFTRPCIAEAADLENKARADLRRFIDEARDDPWAYAGIASILTLLGDNDKAWIYANRLVEASPYYTATPTIIANLKIMEGDYEAALDLVRDKLKTTGKQNPLRNQIQQRVVMSLIGLQRFDEAVIEARQVALSSHSPMSFILLISALVGAGELDEAKEHIKTYNEFEYAWGLEGIRLFFQSEGFHATFLPEAMARAGLDQEGAS